jgi:hypothetical protein
VVVSARTDYLSVSCVPSLDELPVVWFGVACAIWEWFHAVREFSADMDGGVVNGLRL